MILDKIDDLVPQIDEMLNNNQLLQEEFQEILAQKQTYQTASQKTKDDTDKTQTSSQEKNTQSRMIDPFRKFMSGDNSDEEQIEM